jgi:PTH1 family peptidyl-tRNA hydrolase
MWLIVGLGNPGEKYSGNRHNIGFMAVDAIASAYGFPAFKSKYQGEISEGRIGSEKVALLKPQTYMNESGMSVGPAAKFYKILPNHILVFHDELDLPAGKLRMKRGGGHAGHNGLRSLDSHLDTVDYWRARIGIGHPGDRERVHGYVLSDFAKAERPWVDSMVLSIGRHIGLMLDGKDSAFMSKVSEDAPSTSKSI